ncbi:MAG: Dyp-type peroxidase [Gammaproteobacteria bacterium]|nr:Dyp-type peroxidase [Gammaproteobacteria bacterium]
MSDIQQGILADVPATARHLFFTSTPDNQPARALRALANLVEGETIVAGLGQSLVQALGKNIPGLSVFPRYAGVGFDVPSTPAALWCWLRGDDRGELLHLTRQIEHALVPDLVLTQTIDAFRFQSGRDLTGYEDGTENPKGEAAIDAAIVKDTGPGLDGASFVAVQQWLHNFEHFETMQPEEQDNVIGRRRRDNQEITDAPPSAHVKRTAQESFDPEAFVLRRSMPWADDKRAGLVFVAFGKSTAAYEAQLARMVGAEDGISDALFRFTRPITGAYFWCPPMKKGRLDLSAIGI